MLIIWRGIKMKPLFKAKKINSDEWVKGWFTKKEKEQLIVPVIEVYKEWDFGDYIEIFSEVF